MFEPLLQLIVLFLVIFDPLASFTVFLSASSKMEQKQRTITATYAILVALGLSILVLFLGNTLLNLFSTSIDEFKIAGGIILGILGIKMALGLHLTEQNSSKESSAKAIAAIIGTPLLTGPAAITAIIISTHDYGRLMVGIAVTVVLAFTALIFYQAKIVHQWLGETGIKVLSTILGLITVAWGVKFISSGLLAIFH